MANFYNRKSEAAWWWTGDVVWPASATDSNFAAFDTTTGKLIKDSTKNSASFAPALGADDNYVTDAEKTAIGTISGKEDVSNKENTTLDTSTTKYPTNRLVKEYADTKVTLEQVQDNFWGTVWGDWFLKTWDWHLEIAYSDATPSLTLTVIPTVCYHPTWIEFGSTTQQYDVSWTTYVSAVAGGTLWGIPNATAWHTLADCIEAITISRDWKYLNVQEKSWAASATNPNTVQFLFTGMTHFDSINTRSFYEGSVSHNVDIQLWNYTTSAFDTYATFSWESGYVSRTIEVFSPTLYIGTGWDAWKVILQFIHTSSGIETHDYLFDYIALCDGGGGSGGASIASAVAYTATWNISATNVQTAINELDTEKAPIASPTFTGTVTTEGNIELWHASDTTLSRVSAGVMAIEGKNVYMAGGTDVAVADGGTGLSTIADKTMLVANAADTLTALAVGAGQSVRRNAWDTAFEAYTPSAGWSASTQSTFVSGENITAWNALYILPADWKVYKTNASDGGKINFVWFATSSVSAWWNVTVDTSWVSATQTGLTLNSDYYLSNTAGAISTTPWTNVLSIWKAVSNTWIDIFLKDFSYWNSLSTTVLNNPASWTYYSSDMIFTQEKIWSIVTNLVYDFTWHSSYAYLSAYINWVRTDIITLWSYTNWWNVLNYIYSYRFKPWLAYRFKIVNSAANTTAIVTATYQ